LDTPLKRIIMLLHAVHDCPGGRTAAIARHMNFAQITCLLLSQNITSKRCRALCSDAP